MLLGPPASFAHSVIVWAEPIGDEIQVEGYLSDGARLKGGQVLIRDPSGEPLARGGLDQQGRFRFPRPDASAVTVEIILGPAHAGSFELSLQPE